MLLGVQSQKDEGWSSRAFMKMDHFLSALFSPLHLVLCAGVFRLS